MLSEPDFSKALAASPPGPPGWLLGMPVACCPLLAGLWSWGRLGSSGRGRAGVWWEELCPQPLFSGEGNRRSHRVSVPGAAGENESQGLKSGEMGTHEPAGQSPGQCGEQVKAAWEVQEAHRRGTTDPSQQPGPADPSGTRHPFPTALSELICTMREPRRPRCKPETPPEVWGLGG